MSVTTKNSHGRISISDEAIAKVAASVAMECYGVVELVSRGFTDSLKELFKRGSGTRGVKVATVGDRIYIDIYGNNNTIYLPNNFCFEQSSIFIRANNSKIVIKPTKYKIKNII